MGVNWGELYMHINSYFFLPGFRECLILLRIQVPGILATSSAAILLQVGKLRPGVGAGCFKLCREGTEHPLFSLAFCSNGQEMCQYLLMGTAAPPPLVNTSEASLVSPSVRPSWLYLNSASPPQGRSLWAFGCNKSANTIKFIREF